MPNEIVDSIHFQDREDASRQVIETLPIELLSENETVVIGISENGLYIADKIAKALDAKLDILLTEPILAPNNSEVEIAIVSETQDVVIHKAIINSFGINEDYIYGEASRKYDEEVLAYIYKYRKGKEITNLKGKYVVIVDDCVETGLTMMVSLKSIIAKEAKNIYIATPILDRSVYQNLLTVCDGVFCPNIIHDYISIEYYYKEFDILGFDDIKKIINK